MTVQRGDLATASGERLVVVVSGNMYNDLPDHPFVLTADVVRHQGLPPFFVDIGSGLSIEVDTVERTPKARLALHGAQVTVQELTDFDNALFRVLATN